VQIPPEPRQSKCDVCSTLKEQRDCPSTPHDIKTSLSAMIECHRRNVVKERHLYWIRRDLSQSNSSVFLSLIMDGMDQSVTTLPQYQPRTRKCKPFAEFHVFGVLNHCTSKAKFFMCHEGIRKNSNLSIAALLWTLLDVPQPWPPVLFLQVSPMKHDRCSEPLTSHDRRITAGEKIRISGCLRYVLG